MYYVYLLESEVSGGQRYIGLTTDLSLITTLVSHRTRRSTLPGDW